MLRLYCVRHGESKFNARELEQNGDVELTDRGIKQAQLLAKRFSKISIDVIISSDYIRAKQTAEIINSAIHKKIVFYKSLRELKRPTEIEGKHYNDLLTVKVKQLIRKNVDNQQWHYSDEENFFDFRNRIEKFLVALAERKESNILLVAHAEVIRMMLSVIMFKSIVTPGIFNQFQEHIQSNNTGITVFEKTDSGQWKLRTWNDHAHLG